MDILLGLLIIAIGSFGQSSSYVPIKKIKSWEWENFWLVQGVFAWLVFPFFRCAVGCAVRWFSMLIVIFGRCTAIHRLRCAVGSGRTYVRS